MLVIDRSPVDFVLQIDAIYASMKVALFTSRHVKIRKNHSANVLFLKPWCLLISAHAVFTSSVCIVNLCQLCPCTCSFLFVAVYENRLGHLLGVQGGLFALHEMSFRAPKCLVIQVKTTVFFHLKAFNLKMYPKLERLYISTEMVDFWFDFSVACIKNSLWPNLACSWWDFQGR